MNGSMNASMTIVQTRSEFLAERSTLPGRVGCVLTMGALHDGHAALVDAARRDCDSVVVTVFVNPLQFNDTSDLARYPRTLHVDAQLARQHGADLLWAPGVDDVYPGGDVRVSVEAGSLGSDLEGVARPGHFNGMLTVVAKFLNLIRPDVAYFGEKDYQQLTLIRRMVTDLDVGAGSQIVGVPTVREADGLAMSSRNVFLSAQERARAVALSQALTAAGAAVTRHRSAGDVVAAAREAGLTVLGDAGIDPDYFVLRGADLGEYVPGEPGRLLVAARVGDVRLIDNKAVAL